MIRSRSIFALAYAYCARCGPPYFDIVESPWLHLVVVVRKISGSVELLWR